MQKIETSGKTVEAAVKNGLKELGCDASDVDIEILEMGSPGLFGMFGKLAKVRLTVKEKEDDFKFDMPELSLDIEKKPTPRAEKAEKAEPVKAEEPKPAKADKPKAEKPTPARPAAKPAPAPAEAEAEAPQEEKPAAPVKRRNPRRNEKHKVDKAILDATSFEPAPMEPKAPFVAAEPDTWSDAAKMAYEYVETVTKMMGVEVQIELYEEEDTVHMRMLGDTLGVLIGRRGDTLDALQYLTSLYVNKGREDYIRISLDNEDYRARREIALRRLAMRTAQRVCRTGRHVVLEPMNPYERRIMHSALQGHPLVETHSEGEDPFRRVVIMIKEDV